VDGGAHKRASAGGDNGHCGAARCCARANAREEDSLGRREGLLARMHASWLGQLGRGALGATRGQRRLPNGAARPAAAHGCGPGHDGQHVVHAVTAYGRRALWAQRGHRCGADGMNSHAERAPAFQTVFVSLRPPLTDSNSKTLN
jgi:hypothetical protein